MAAFSSGVRKYLKRAYGLSIESDESFEGKRKDEAMGKGEGEGEDEGSVTLTTCHMWRPRSG